MAIIDVRMPPDLTDDGLRAAIEIRREQPEVGVLVFSQHLVERFVTELMGDDARGVGYLLKHRIADLGYFVDAVRSVAQGGTALDPEVVARMFGRRRREDPLEALTPREREVLALMAEALSNNGIAERLTVQPPAVEKHVTAIFSKLGIARDRAENQRVLAVLTLLRAARWGITPRTRRSATSSVPPRTASRSSQAAQAGPLAGSAPPRPSSEISIVSVSSSLRTVTSAWVASACLNTFVRRLGDREVGGGLDRGIAAVPRSRRGARRSARSRSAPPARQPRRDR